MADPLFWLGLSILLVAVSLTAVLVAALPAFRELARASRSAEKLFDTLSRELPPTLESIRMTGIEISDLTDDVSQSVQSAGRVVKQVDQSLGSVKQQAKKAQKVTRSVVIGVQAAWKTLTRPQPPKRSLDRLSPGTPLQFDESYSDHYSSRSYSEYAESEYSNYSESDYSEDNADNSPQTSQYKDVP